MSRILYYIEFVLLLHVLLNYALSHEDHFGSLRYDWIRKFGGDNDRGKPKYHKQNLSQCHCAQHKTKVSREKPVAVPLCPPQNPHEVVWVYRSRGTLLSPLDVAKPLSY